MPENVIVDPKKWDEATRGLEKSAAGYDPKKPITDAERVAALKDAGLEGRAAQFEEAAKRKPLPPPRPRQGIELPKTKPITREEQVAALKGLAAEEENVVGSNKWAEAAAELEQKVKPKKGKPEIVQGWTAAKKALEVDADKKAVKEAQARIAAAKNKR